MKLLVATKKTQGHRENDFCFCDEEELVMFGWECDGEAIDEPCGCRRAMAGFKTKKKTTTMKVKEIDLTREQFRAMWVSSMCEGGWLDGTSMTEEENRWADREVKELISLGKAFKPGMVIEKRGNTFQERIIL